MTVSGATARVSYAGDGSTAVFAVPFYFLDADDLTVILRDAAGSETTWVRNTHYTVSGAGNPAGGSVTVDTDPTDFTPATGTTLVILRSVPLTQETDYTEGDPLPAATLERDFDKARMVDQQLGEALGRALTFTQGSPSSGITMPEPAASKLVAWNAAATALVNVAAADVSLTAVSAFVQTLLDDVDADAALATLTALKDALTTRGDLLVEGASGPARLGIGAAGQALLSDGTDSYWGGISTQPNAIINGDFRVAQRGTSFSGGTDNADDTYTLDRWYILAEGNDTVDVTRSTEAPTNGLYSIALDVETTGEKFGIAQIIEQKNCLGLVGQEVTLSFKAKVSNARIDTVKVAIVAWSGTADTVTSDIISTWNADGTTPTLIANATFENTPVDLGVTTDWATYSVTATVDTANAKNIIVFIWSDDATNPQAGDFFYTTDVQIEVGGAATAFKQRPYSIELDLCQCYYIDGPSTGRNTIFSSNVTPGFIYYAIVYLPRSMRANPTVVLTNIGASGFPATTMAQVIGRHGFNEYRTANANQSGAFFNSTYTADAEL